MKYCRYCAYCISGDCFYCTCKEIELKHINKSTNCKEFVLTDVFKDRYGNYHDDVIYEIIFK